MSLVINILFIIVGLVGIFFGVTQYGFWNGMISGSGFLPTIAGAILSIFSLLMILDKKLKSDTKFDIKILFPVAALVLAIGGSYVIGMMLSLTLMMFLWLAIVERYKWYKALLYALITGAATYAMFGLWLRVPFPKGMLGIL